MQGIFQGEYGEGPLVMVRTVAPVVRPLPVTACANPAQGPPPPSSSIDIPMCQLPNSAPMCQLPNSALRRRRR